LNKLEVGMVTRPREIRHNVGNKKPVA
jgi:hypothetical protein